MTDTTREGLMDAIGFAQSRSRPLHLNGATTLEAVEEYLDAFNALRAAAQAAKADELAFLESLIVGDGDDYPYNAIERRIAYLKGESRE